MKTTPKMRTLKAIKPHSYGTRHLTAGEEYEAPARYAVALVAAKKAKFADKTERRAPAKPEPFVTQRWPTPETGETSASLDGLRHEATQLGIAVDGRWGAMRLQQEIAKVKG